MKEQKCCEKCVWFEDPRIGSHMTCGKGWNCPCHQEKYCVCEKPSICDYPSCALHGKRHCTVCNLPIHPTTEPKCKWCLEGHGKHCAEDCECKERPSVEQGHKAICPKAGTPHLGCGICNPTHIPNRRVEPKTAAEFNEEADRRTEDILDSAKKWDSVEPRALPNPHSYSEVKDFTDRISESYDIKPVVEPREWEKFEHNWNSPAWIQKMFGIDYIPAGRISNEVADLLHSEREKVRNEADWWNEKLQTAYKSGRGKGYAEGCKDSKGTKNGVQRYQIGYEDGQADERKAVMEMCEEMKRKGMRGTPKEFDIEDEWNSALSSLGDKLTNK